MNFRSLWLRPEEQMPRIPVGDRILIVADRPRPGEYIGPRLAILEYTKTGDWKSEEGYKMEDAILWATEKSVVMCAPLKGEGLQ